MEEVSELLRKRRELRTELEEVNRQLQPLYSNFEKWRREFNQNFPMRRLIEIPASIKSIKFAERPAQVLKYMLQNKHYEDNPINHSELRRTLDMTSDQLYSAFYGIYFGLVRHGILETIEKRERKRSLKAYFIKGDADLYLSSLDKLSLLFGVRNAS